MAAIILLLLLTPFQLVAADVFCDNVKAVAAILSQNASASPVHFASATYGQAPDAVDALALCGGDILNGSSCGTCIPNWFDNALSLQPQCAKVGSNYRDCIIAYGGAGANILAVSSNATGGSGDNTPPFESWNARNVSGDGNVTLVANLGDRGEGGRHGSQPVRHRRHGHGERVRDLPERVLPGAVHAGPARPRVLGLPAPPPRHGQLHHVPAHWWADGCHPVLLQDQDTGGRGKGKTMSFVCLTLKSYWRQQVIFQRKANLEKVALALSTRASFQMG